jgi:hypothetical protein
MPLPNHVQADRVSLFKADFFPYILGIDNVFYPYLGHGISIGRAVLLANVA